MKVRITKAFSKRIEEQVEFIAKDKPLSARKFKSDIMKAVRDIPKFPYRNRKSIFFDRNDIRDLIFKGYVIIYKINKTEMTVEIFGFIKWTDDPSYVDKI